MSEQGQQEDADPNVNFKKKKLYDLIDNKKFNEAIEFLNNDRITLENKRAAVNYKGEHDNTTLMLAAAYAPLTLIQQLCEIGGKPLIMDKHDNGDTALHIVCYRDANSIDIVRYLVQNGGMELINKKTNFWGRTALDIAKLNEEDDSIYNFLFYFGRSFEDKKIHGGLNDDPKQTPDRLDYDKYAEGIVNVATKAEMSGNYFCVGLYGPWGSGKTKLWNLIKTKLENRGETKDGGSKDVAWNWLEGLQQLFLGPFFRIVEMSCCRCCCELPTHISDGCDAIQDAQKKERNEVVALLFIILLPIWISFGIILGILIILLQGYVSASEKFCKCCRSDNEPPPRWEYILVVVPERVLNFINESTSMKRTEMTEDIIKVLTAQRSLFHAFSRRVPCTLSACIRLTALSPFWLLAWFYFACWKYLKISVGSVWKLCCCRGRKQKLISEDDVKYIFTDFNAWTYNGSDNLWASFMEILWTDVESHFGRYAVRRHRASIALSSGKDSDDIETKTRKRDEALFRYFATTIFAFLITVAGVGLGVFLLAYFGKCAIEDGDPVPECRYEPLSDLEANITDSDGESAFVLGESADITRKVFGILAVTISPLPFFMKLHTFIKHFLPYLKKPKEVLQDALLGEGYNRNDFSAETGFMGIVKTEAEYLFDFVKTQRWYDDEQKKYRNVRMCICVDDLDRCNSQTTVSVLEAMFLLLSESPITCYLAIDTKLVVASIDEHRSVHDRAGVTGYDFLEKLVQLEFCIPDLTNTKKKDYMNLLFYEGLLDPLKILGIIKKLRDNGSKRIESYFKDVDTNDMKYRDADIALDAIRVGMKKALSNNALEKKIEEVEGQVIRTFDFGPLNAFLADSPRTISDIDSVEKEKIMFTVLEYLRKEQKDLRHYGNTHRSLVNRVVRIIKKKNMRHFHFEHYKVAGESDLNSKAGLQEILKGMENVRCEATSGFDFVPIEHWFGEDIDFTADQNITIMHTVLDYLRDDSGVCTPAPVANNRGREITATSKEPANSIDGALRAMVTDEEWQWFNEFVQYFVGKPRSINRVVNVYNVCRHVSERDGGHNGNPTFRKKLLKMLILAEFWPYRTSWLLQVIADAGQHAEIDDLKRILDKSLTSDTLGSIESVVPNVFVLLKKVMIEKKKSNKHDFFKTTSLLDLYKKVVEALLHSPSKDANKMLSRDYDPQLFEMLLGETSADTNVASLTMSDLLLPDQSRPTNDDGSLFLSVRPFLFNMPQHMTEYTSSRIDDLVFFYEGDPGQVLLRYEYKKDYYNRNQLSISLSSGGDMKACNQSNDGTGTNIETTDKEEDAQNMEKVERLLKLREALKKENVPKDLIDKRFPIRNLL